MSSRWQHDRPMLRARSMRVFRTRRRVPAILLRNDGLLGSSAPHVAYARVGSSRRSRSPGSSRAATVQTSRQGRDGHASAQAATGRLRSGPATVMLFVSKLPLRTSFEAIHLLTSHSNGISAEQAQAPLGIASYKHCLVAAPEAPTSDGLARLRPAPGPRGGRRDRGALSV